MSLSLTLPRRSPALFASFASTSARSYSSREGTPFSDSQVTSSTSTASSSPAAPSRPATAPSLLSLADLSTAEITRLVTLAQYFKTQCKPPVSAAGRLEKSLADKTVALLFSKRSTRTRVASETSTKLLGGHSMFLGPQDIQLGVNESLKDTSVVLGSMVDGIMARVASHDDVEMLAAHSKIPIINALSDLYHPTQTLASLLTLAHIYKNRTPTQSTIVKPPPASNQAAMTNPPTAPPKAPASTSWSTLLAPNHQPKDMNKGNPLDCLKGLKVAWVGDCNNVVNDMIVAYPRLGIELRVASPGGKDGEYGLDKRVEAKLAEFGHSSSVVFTGSPAEALKDADIVVTDTWISMGEEAETAKRLADFSGFQITEALAKESGAAPDWKFMHCLPRHHDEVDDEVFYGDRSTVFAEAENRKWSIMAIFHSYFGKWRV